MQYDKLGNEGRSFFTFINARMVIGYVVWKMHQMNNSKQSQNFDHSTSLEF